jgi:uncharacterized membrane protein YvbJ
MQYTYCHHCGKRLLAGAMRCVSCGKILKTPEEQIESVEIAKGKKKTFNVWPVIKVVLFVLIIGIVYNKFSDQIIAYLHQLIGK